MNKQTIEWLKNVVNGIEASSTDQECMRILDERGRACTPQQLIDVAKEIYSRAESMDAFLNEFRGVFEFLQIENGEISVVYPQCFCHHLAGLSMTDVPDAYCECSRGWVQELFEKATGQDVTVDVIDSVVRGGETCRFLICFPSS